MTTHVPIALTELGGPVRGELGDERERERQGSLASLALGSS